MPKDQIRQISNKLEAALQKIEEISLALKESEDQYHQLIEQHSAIMLMIDPHSRIIVDANTAAAQFYGYPLAVLIGLSVEKINAKPESEMHQQRQLVLQGKSNQFVVDHQLANGEVRTVNVLTSTIRIKGKPLFFSILHDVTEQKQLQQELERQAHLDYLTGLSNRGSFMHHAEIELARAIRYDNKLCIFMMDIDHFKQVNDNYGHQTGDLVLKKLAEICKEVLREVDIIGRVGGEEFAILLPETSEDEGAEVAERLRVAIEKARVPLDRGLPVLFHVSIGVASLLSRDDNLDVLLAKADKALYEAKSAGRNRIQVGTLQ